jgi:hypothetical protein
MSKNKLHNVKTIQQMLDGTHKFQTKKTTGFTDAENASQKNKLRLVGESWEETDVNGNTYIVEQKDGFRIRKTKNNKTFQELRTELNTFTKCRKEICTCITPNHLDEKMRVFNGMCYDCTIEFEHELRTNGKYDEYEQHRIKQNAMAWLNAAEYDVDVLKNAYTQASKFVTNADGETETYAARMTPEEFNEKVESQFNEFKQRFLNRLNGEVNETN